MPPLNVNGCEHAVVAGRAWGVAGHDSLRTDVAYVVDASMKEGRPVLHHITAAVHCILAVNPTTTEPLNECCFGLRP